MFRKSTRWYLYSFMLQYLIWHQPTLNSSIRQREYNIYLIYHVSSLGTVSVLLHRRGCIPRCFQRLRKLRMNWIPIFLNCTTNIVIAKWNRLGWVLILRNRTRVRHTFLTMWQKKCSSFFKHSNSKPEKSILSKEKLFSEVMHNLKFYICVAYIYELLA
jgi:hypothetical protein